MIKPIDYIDTLAISVLVYRERKLFDEGSIDVIAKRKDPNWKIAKTILTRALASFAQADALLGGDGEQPREDSAYLTRLLPGGVDPWSIEPKADFIRCVLPIITNPMCLTYSGTFQGFIPAGQLTLVNVMSAYSQVNHGRHAVYQMVIDLAKPAPEQAPEPAN